MRFLFILFIALALPGTAPVLAASSICTTSSCPAQISDAKILALLAPVKTYASHYTQTHPVPQTIAETQKQVAELMKDPQFIALTTKANERLNQLAVQSDTRGPFGVLNYDQITPHIYRSANPTLAQAESLVSSGQIDTIVSLNMELKTLVALDPAPDIPLTPERRKAIEKKLQDKHTDPEKISYLLDFYQTHIDYALTLREPKKYSWHEFFPLGSPDKTLPAYFAALQRLTELKQEKKNVLLHCKSGQHRAGIIALLVNHLEQPNQPMDQLYIDFIRHNWDQHSDSRTHYLAIVPLIIRSGPFQTLPAAWSKSGKD
jgi:hypothetical protein